MAVRPSIEDVKRTFLKLLRDKKFWLPKGKNKGAVGQRIEKILGIPNSSACLDCSDGEVKVFPLKKMKRSGKLVPKETVAITMRGLKPANLSNPLLWDDSDLKKKTHNMLFIPYYRDGDYILCHWNPISFGYLSPEYIQFKTDYKTIMDYYKCHGIRTPGQKEKAEWKKKGIKPPSLNTINGTYIQGRTKGPGGNKPKTVGLYFRRIQFVQNIIWSKINENHS